MRKYITKDSGKKEKFKTGAQRDYRAGKGRFDLIPPTPLQRLADVYERGAVKYGDCNWAKGMPFSRLLDSTLRHLNKRSRGLKDEDHLAQAVFNIFAMMHFEDMGRKELDDLQVRWGKRK